MQHATIMGRLGKDPEHLVTKNNNRMYRFSVGVGGKKKTSGQTTWWSVLVTNEKLFPIIQWLKKGKPVVISGSILEARIWTGKDGQPHVDLSLSAEAINFTESDREQVDPSLMPVGLESPPTAVDYATAKMKSPAQPSAPPVFETDGWPGLDENIPF